jgi:hypothetical protein
VEESYEQRARAAIRKVRDALQDRAEALDALLETAESRYAAWEDVLAADGEVQPEALEIFFSTAGDLDDATERVADVLGNEQALIASADIFALLHVSLVNVGIIKIKCAACDAHGERSTYTAIEPPSTYSSDFTAHLCPECAARR